MSRYETRSHTIKSGAAAMGWHVGWRRQRTRLYFWVNTADSNSKHLSVYNWVKEWYPDAVMTSWGSRGGTFFIGDIWEMLKSG